MDRSGVDEFDLTIIGGGPTGLFAAFYAGMRGLRTKLIEGAPALGGKLLHYSDKFVYDVGGIPAITAGALARQLEEQAATFAPTVVLSEMVEQADWLGSGYRLVSDTGAEHFTRTVLIATGGGTLQPRRLDAALSAQYTGANVRYAVERMEHFRGKRVLVLGGGNTAVDYALALTSVAEEVTVVHRREEFTAHEGSVAELLQSAAQIVTPHRVTELDVRGGELRGAVVECTSTGRTSYLECDDIIVCHGSAPDLGGMKHWGLPLQGTRILVGEAMETNRPAMYAAGDAVRYPGKLAGLIAGGFLEGSTAVNGSKVQLLNGEEIAPVWSTFHEGLLAIHGA